MAVIAILTDQTDFTGEFPITDHVSEIPFTQDG